MTGKLEGKVAVVTGETGALGKQTAELMLQEGAKVAPLIEQTIEDFESVININVKGIFLELKHVLPVMAA